MHCDIQPFAEYAVTPFVGVWIETLKEKGGIFEPEVTPFVGVWIETQRCRGSRKAAQVTPFVGVWIETRNRRLIYGNNKRHTLRGCVD